MMQDICILTRLCSIKEVRVVMNTSEKKSFSIEEEQGRRCSFCGAAEGKPHPMRGFKVELSHPIGDDKGELACQVCRIHFRKKKAEKASSVVKKTTIIFAGIVLVAAILIIIGISLN